MVVVPLVALTALLGLEIADRFSRQSDLERLVEVSALMGTAEEVTDGLQLERGGSSLYLASDGTMHHSELIEQWGKTDAAIAEFKEVLDETEGVFLTVESVALLEVLSQIDDMRGGILDRDVTWTESLLFYTDLIEQFRASPSGLNRLTYSDPQLSGIVMGILHLWDSTEAAGVERAVVSKLLVEGSIERDDVDLLARLAGRRKDSLEAYRVHTPRELRVEYEAQVSDFESSSINDVRRQIVAGDLRLDPDEWFAAASVPMDILSSVEDGLVEDLATRSRMLADEARSSMWIFSLFGVVVLLASLVVAGRVGRRLSERTDELARVARAVQRGDFSQRANVDAGDELGTLGIAFNQMTDDLTTLNRRLETQVEDRTAELKVSEAHNRAMLEAIPDLIVRLGSDGMYIDFVFIDDSNGQQVFPQPERYVGKHIEEILPLELAKEFLEASRRARDTGTVQQLEYQYPMGEEVREREARVVAIPGSEETMLVVRDITERKSQDRHLEDLIRSKDELIASISHELRTPLTAVLGFAELLQDETSDISLHEEREMLAAISEQATDLSHIVEDLLVAARVKVDTLRVARIPVDLREQLAQVLGTLRGTSIDDLAIDGESVVALGDPGRIRQILRNLLTNAVRYGGDDVEIRMSSDGSTAILQVRDDGLGVSEEDQDAIFEAYHQSHRITGSPGSVGIGLTISRSLARMMDGDLTYRYEDGISIFEMVLASSQAPEGHTRLTTVRHGSTALARRR